MRAINGLCLSVFLHSLTMIAAGPGPYAEFPPTTGKYRMLIGVPHDGDTIQAWHLVPVHGGLRLYGIQAPELKSPTGTASRDNLATLIPFGLYDVELKGKEKFGRCLAVIKLPSGSDASTAQIAGGFAIPWDGKGPRP